MSTEDLQKRTTVNIQEKANLIWAIADKLVGTYKPHEYGNVILPMCVIKRFSDTLAPTKQKVLDANALCEQRGLAVRKGFLTTASGYDFYNVSPFTFEGLLSDADNIADNFRSYLNLFSENVVDIIEKFDFDKEITKLDHNGILYNVIQEFCSKKPIWVPMRLVLWIWDTSSKSWYVSSLRATTSRQERTSRLATSSI